MQRYLNKDVEFFQEKPDKKSKFPQYHFGFHFQKEYFYASIK